MSDQFSEKIRQLERELAERTVVAEESLRQLERERGARLRLAILSEASAVLASSLDFQKTLTNIARLTTPFLADCCLIYERSEEGELRVLGRSCHLPEHLALLENPTDLFAARPNDPDSFIFSVLQAGEPLLLPEIALDLGNPASTQPPIKEREPPLTPKSVMILPMVAHGQTLGVIVLLLIGTERQYSEDDLELGRELATRTAQAMENAHLHQIAQQENMEHGRTVVALRESERRFQAFMDNHPAVAWIVDEQNRILYVNRRWEQRFQRRRDECIGKTAFDLWPEEPARQIIANNRAVLDSEQTIETIESAPTPDGVMQHWLVFKFPMRDSAGRRNIGGMGVDITERKAAEEALHRSEEQFRLLFENSNDGIVVADDSGRYVQVNAAACGILGYSREQLLQMTVGDLVTTEEVAADRYARYIQQGQESGEFALVRPDGETRIIEYNACRIAPDQHLSLLRDVTVRKRDETELKRLFEQIQAGRMRLRTLSHQLIQTQEAERRDIARELHDEIGQELTVLKINLQVAQGTQDTKVQSARLEDSLQIVEQALQQVRSLSLNLRPSLLDDLGLDAALRWYVDRLTQRTGIDARCEVNKPEQPVPAELATACFRIAQEALTNVVRHAQAQRVMVRLQYTNEELWLRVEDDGKGFDAAAAHGRAARGASLGLLGMEERAQLVGGSVDILSSPGEGTTVRAHFPLDASPVFP